MYLSINQSIIQRTVFAVLVYAKILTNYCRGKALSITYSECVSIALLIQNAKAYYIAIGDLSGSTIFSHIIS